MENRENRGVKDAEPVCDHCPRNDLCTFMCQNRLDQFLVEEEQYTVEEINMMVYGQTTQRVV